MATQRLLVLLLFVVVGAVQGDPTLRRHRRFLDVEQFEDGKSLFEREGFFFPYSKKAAGLSRGSSQSARFLMMKPSSRKTKKKSKGDKEDGYWMDLMSMSMSMPTTPAPQPPAPSPVSVPTSPTTPTPSPFRECNSSPRDEAFLNILVGVTPADELLDPLTPQGAAFQWLVENDPAQVDPCTYNVDQRYALAAFYYATDGPGWTDQGSWLSAESECLWSGVSCEGGLVVSLIQSKCVHAVVNECMTLFLTHCLPFVVCLCSRQWPRWYCSFGNLGSRKDEALVVVQEQDWWSNSKRSE